MTEKPIPTIRELRSARARYSHELKMAENHGEPTKRIWNAIDRIDAQIEARYAEEQ